MFSPYYRWAHRKGAVDPEQHCALNVSLYGAPRRWAMTERNAAMIARTHDSFIIGPSAVHWRGDHLVIEVCEICAPVPRRLRGRITVRPNGVFRQTFALDEKGLHRWTPIGPHSRVEVEMERPGLRWSGNGYLDHNHGDKPLEDGFSQWDWSRAHRGDETIVHYEARTRDGENRNLSLLLSRSGNIEHVPSLPRVALPQTPVWRVARRTRATATAAVRIVKTLEDTPFYARSLLTAAHHGELLTGFHESLDLDRFTRPIVQAMLPFRMPRTAR